MSTNETLKVDLYKFIHKAQRMHLFDLSVRIGRTDFSNENEVNAVLNDLKDMIAHLRKHSHSEETFVHPLFKEIGDLISIIDEEHDDLEIELLKIENVIQEKRWDDLYPELNRFIASYLMHQDEEETLQKKILWKHFENDRLSAVMTNFKNSLTPEQEMDNLKFIIPTLTCNEIIKMFHK